MKLARPELLFLIKALCSRSPRLMTLYFLISHDNFDRIASRADAVIADCHVHDVAPSSFSRVGRCSVAYLVDFITDHHADFASLSTRSGGCAPICFDASVQLLVSS